MSLIRQNIEPDGVASLRARQRLWRTSLGIVKVKHLADFHIDGDPEEIIREADWRAKAQRTLGGASAGMEGSKIDRIAHMFRYTWGCNGSCCAEKPSHDMQCEDWEVFESFRSWCKRYNNKDEFDSALWTKYYDQMSQKELYFVLGTTSDPRNQQSPTIIGIVYPKTDNPDLRPLAPKYNGRKAFRAKQGTKKKRMARVKVKTQRRLEF